jgi:plasmid replication initiation protein
MTSPSDRLVKINESLKHARGIPQNKWDYGKMHEMHENNVKEALKRLAAHEIQISEFESKCRLRGVDESEIQKGVYQSFSHQHIQLLEAVIAAKKTLAMMDIGTVEDLTRQKIAILEELVSS